MKLYIWENSNISCGYHDDGTLVVLAESVEQAREIAMNSEEWSDKDRAYGGGRGRDITGAEALQEEPTTILDINKPTFVVFNGGGYD